MNSDMHLARRERQIMDVVYRLGEATVAGVLAELPDPPSYSAVRAMMRLLEEKGHLRHKKRGARYVYRPTRSRESASRSALKHVLQTFFDGSAEHAVVALLGMPDYRLTKEELERISRIIDEARSDPV